MFVIEDKMLKFWAYQDAVGKVEEIEWREEFVDAFNNVEKPQLFAIEHGNVTKVIAIVGTYLHAFDFYEYGLTFKEIVLCSYAGLRGAVGLTLALMVANS